MVITSNMFIVIFLIFYTIKLGEGLHCYRCESSEKDYCDSPFNKTAAIVELCAKDVNSCVHFVEKFNGNVKVNRRCDDQHYCKLNTIDTKKRLKCDTCSTEYCNNSFNLKPTVTILLNTIVLQCWYTWLNTK